MEENTKKGASHKEYLELQVGILRHMPVSSDRHSIETIVVKICDILDELVEGSVHD